MKEERKSSDNTFENVIENGVTLVDFNASWCAPCRAQDPIVKQLATNFTNKANITSLDIDENREIALKLSIHSIPTLILFKDGKEIQRFIGIQSEETLSQAIENGLK